MKRGSLGVLAALVACAAGCGIAPNKRLLTRVDDYNKSITFPYTGDPVDLERIVREFPELKGIVVTAPEYIEEYARELALATAQDRPLIAYRIPAGAAISIEVEDESDLTRVVTVPPTGYYQYPRIGRIRFEGLTIEELQASFESKLRVILKKPVVNINIASSPPTFGVSPAGNLTATPSSTGSEIYVFGAVSTAFNTGGVAFTGGQTLITVLGRTGFPGTAEWRQVRIIRRSPVDPLRKSRVIICDLWNYFAYADVRQDVPLMPGDVIYVPLRWSLGQQFEKDWGLLMKYMGDATFFANYRKQFQPGGAFRD